MGVPTTIRGAARFLQSLDASPSVHFRPFRRDANFSTTHKAAAGLGRAGAYGGSLAQMRMRFSALGRERADVDAASSAGHRFLRNIAYAIDPSSTHFSA